MFKESRYKRNFLFQCSIWHSIWRPTYALL